MVLDDFENPGPFSFPGFRAGVLAAKLRHTERGTKVVLDRSRKSQQIVLCWNQPRIAAFRQGLSLA